MPKTKDRDTIASRLAGILALLNEGKKLQPTELAEQFNVDLRTIQRDLRERLAFLDLVKTDGAYHLPLEHQGRLGLGELERFAALAGVQGLFPSLNTEFMRTLLSDHLQKSSPLLVKAPAYEDISEHAQVFKMLEHAVRHRRVVSFSYEKEQGLKSYVHLEPYKLINHSGVWYAACADQGQMKAFTLSKIRGLDVSHAIFVREMQHEQMLEEEDSIWLNANKTEVVLKVQKAAAHYFMRRKLIGGQVIEKELADGGLIVSGKVAHPNQILPIVRYWLPNVRIISPEGLQVEMERELRGYLSL
jgi:predicted DNA-binding transcriptional regulator YafY